MAVEEDPRWPAEEPADPEARVDLTRTAEGRVMCCICFGYHPVGELSVTVTGDPQDICRRCATVEIIWLAAAQRSWDEDHAEPGEPGQWAAHWRSLTWRARREQLAAAAAVAVDNGLYGAEEFLRCG